MVENVSCGPPYPVALVTTPQTYKIESKRLTSKNGYNLDQFEGRFTRQIPLPEEVSAADTLAVVKHKLPELPESLQKEINKEIGFAGEDLNFLSAVKIISETCRWIAEKAGRDVPNASDVQTAINECIPNARQRRDVYPAPCGRSQPVEAQHVEIRQVKPATMPSSPAREIKPLATTTL
jgi:hypothetical protein